MATDYVKEHPDYVRGMMEDAIQECSFEVSTCEMCKSIITNKVGCHYQCRRCGNHVTCSD
jgi:hypothetical protein